MKGRKQCQYKENNDKESKNALTTKNYVKIEN